LRAELLKAEAAHFAKKNGTPMELDNGGESVSIPSKRAIGAAADEADEDAETKRRRLILEEAQELDADSAGSSEEDSDEEYVLRIRLVDLI
jgi:protein CWC15